MSGSYYFKVPAEEPMTPREYWYDPPLVDYHYRLEWDLVDEHEFAATHQVRIFDQGGEVGWHNFNTYRGDIAQAEAMGMVKNMTYSHRDVVIAEEWLTGLPEEK